MAPGADDTLEQTTSPPLAPGQFYSVCAGAVQRVAHLGGQSARHQAAQGLSGTWRCSFPTVVVRRWCGGESRSAVPRWRCLRLRRRHRRYLYRVLTLNRRLLCVVCCIGVRLNLLVSPPLFSHRGRSSLRCAVFTKKKNTLSSVLKVHTVITCT